MKNTTCDVKLHGTIHVWYTIPCNILCYLKTSARNKTVPLHFSLQRSSTPYSQTLQRIYSLINICKQFKLLFGWPSQAVLSTVSGSHDGVQNIVRRCRENPAAGAETLFMLWSILLSPLYFSSSQVHQHQRRCPEKEIIFLLREFHSL